MLNYYISSTSLSPSSKQLEICQLILIHYSSEAEIRILPSLSPKAYTDYEQLISPQCTCQTDAQIVHGKVWSL